jgi:hypothetical protein
LCSAQSAAGLLWLVCQGYFNPGFVEMVAGMMKDAPVIDLWDRRQAIQ